MLAKNFIGISLLVALFFVSACEKASETVVSIPTVVVGCTTGDDALCSTANPKPVTAFVRMTRSGCGASLAFDPVATGSVVMNCDASGCDGTITSWINPETSDPVTEILTGTMDVCAQVDIDDSTGLPNSGDLIYEESQNILSSRLITIDTWTTQP